jgi:small redox-active disulfide protein 2
VDGYLIFFGDDKGNKMKKIQILGTGCAKCTTLYKNTKMAAIQAKIEFEIEKVTELKEIMAMGVMTTPALVVDGQVKASGQLLSVEQIEELLKQ